MRKFLGTLLAASVMLFFCASVIWFVFAVIVLIQSF
jgi:hypothetical protein